MNIKEPCVVCRYSNLCPDSICSYTEKEMNLRCCGNCKQYNANIGEQWCRRLDYEKLRQSPIRTMVKSRGSKYCNDWISDGLTQEQRKI